MAGPIYLTTPNPLDPISTAQGLNRAILLVFKWRQGSLQNNITGDLYDIRYRIGAGAFTTISNQTPNPTGGVQGNARDYSHNFAPNTFAAATTYGWQVRMREPGSGLFTAWSSEAFFRVEAAPTAPVITSPTAGATLTATPHSVTWTLTTQAAYRVYIMNGGTLDYDSGVVSSVALRSHSTPLLTNGSRTIIVETQSAAGMPWGQATVAVTVNVVPPATPSAVTSTTVDTASIGVRHNTTLTSTHPTPSGGQPAVTSVDYYARRVGSAGNGALIGTSSTSSGGTWPLTYPRLQQGTWEFSAIAVSADGRRSVQSAWTAATLQPNIVGVVISHPTDTASACFFRFNDEGAQENVAVESGLMQYVGRVSPVVEFDATIVNRGLQVPKLTCRTVDVAQLTMLKTLLLMRTPLVYRDKRGRKAVGLLTIETISDVAHGYELGVSFVETHYPSDVLT